MLVRQELSVHLQATNREKCQFKADDLRFRLLDSVGTRNKWVCLLDLVKS